MNELTLSNGEIKCERGERSYQEVFCGDKEAGGTERKGSTMVEVSTHLTTRSTCYASASVGHATPVASSIPSLSLYRS